jgi:GxxExxY protein
VLNDQDVHRYEKMHADIKDKKYKHKEITEKIIKCSFEVQNNLGCGFLEKVYHKALLHEFKTENLKVEHQKVFKIFYKDKEVGIYMPDFVVDDKIIVEIKSVEFLTKTHKAQLLNYLKAANYEVGLILNFFNPRLEYKRIVA